MFGVGGSGGEKGYTGPLFENKNWLKTGVVIKLMKINS
jgi:hypothetical protein